MLLWPRSKTAQPAVPTGRLIGVDVNSSRALAVTASGGTAKSIALTDSAAELPLFIHLESKPVVVGHVAKAICRRSPHLVCSNFLNQLGVPREWRGPRVTLTPEAALLAVFETLRRSLATIGEHCALTLPEYLSPVQVKAALDLAAKAKLTLTGSASSALAIAAHRAESFLTPKKQTASPVEKPDWVVPLHPREGGPGVIVIIDVDEAALSAAALEVGETETRLLTNQHWPRASLKLWKDRLLDAISDRCVRLARRDPRDSAQAEQGLYDQLDDALEQSRRGAIVTLTARADRWYQDLKFAPADLEAFTQALANLALDEIRGAVTSLALPSPPRAIWLSASAAMLPGLAAALHEQSPEGTDVAVLPPEAAAEAAAALDARIRAGSLPAGHHEAVIANLPKVSKLQQIGRQVIS
jgi:hypothetical protein